VTSRSPAAARLEVSSRIRWPSAEGAWLPALVIALVAAAAAFARITLVGHGSLGFLVGAGRTYSDPARLPAGFPVRGGNGYDGQFMYRLAHDPFDWQRQASGVRLDGVFRLGRIGYPLLVWVVSLGGKPALLPAGLLLVGVAALAMLAALGAAYARRCGLAAGWGLLVCWPGLLFSIDYDLAEPLEVALVVAGLLAVRAGRQDWAAAALSGAALTRETALVAVAAVALCRVPALWRQRRFGVSDLAWFVPVVVFAGWQLACRLVTGRFPITSDASSNVQTPSTGLVDAWSRWSTIARSHPGGAWLHAIELAVLVAVVCTALIAGRRRSSPAFTSIGTRDDLSGVTNPLVVATVLGAVSALWASVAVWASGSDLRMFADTYACAALVLLPATPRKVLAGWAIAAGPLAIGIISYRALVV
jgi:hypothetical protein